MPCLVRVALSAAALVFVTTISNAGPFGLEFGQPISKLKVVQNLGDNSYIVAAPTPNSEFVQYGVYAAPGYGVCRIVGFGKDHDGDASGIEIRQVFEGLKTALTEKYGSSTNVYDFRHSGTIWSGWNDFAMGVKLNEITLAASWDPGNYPGGISNIMLEVGARTSTTTYVTLAYESANMKQCHAGSEEKDKNAL